MGARILTYRDNDAVRALLAADPVRNLFVSSRLDAGVLSSANSATLWGYPDREPRALLHAGSNLAPVNLDPEAMSAFVEKLGPRRTCQAIVGPSQEALALWRALCERWGEPYRNVREVRPRQPVMVFTGSPLVPVDPRVHAIGRADFASYFAAAVAMYTEEVGVDPLAGGGEAGYTNYCRWLVQEGRAFGIVQGGRVIFKSDVGAAAGPIAQIQGVWLEPSLRGRGLAASAMAGVCALVTPRFPTVSLYVNDFNTRAIRTYERVGFQTVGEFATVLY